jgi:phosphohistidine phosphatase
VKPEAAQTGVKQLILFRHAKSSWDDDVTDVDRPLAGRGERDAPRMGKRLDARHARPGLILTSHAARAQRTAELVAKPLGIKRREVRVERALYLASPDEILAVVASQDDSVSCVLLVGHNPGLTELVNKLLPDLALDNLPTSGVVAIDLSTTSWRNVSTARAKLAYYDYPKNPELIVTEN